MRNLTSVVTGDFKNFIKCVLKMAYYAIIRKDKCNLLQPGWNKSVSSKQSKSEGKGQILNSITHLWYTE